MADGLDESAYVSSEGTNVVVTVPSVGVAVGVGANGVEVGVAVGVGGCGVGVGVSVGVATCGVAVGVFVGVLA